MSPRKEEIIEGLFEGIQSTGKEPISPTNARMFKDKRRQAKHYYYGQVNHAIKDARKEVEIDWGPAGKTGSSQRDYTPDQTRRILYELDKIVKHSSARGKNLRDSGLSSEAIAKARETLLGDK
jgi:hypothetical protein